MFCHLVMQAAVYYSGISETTEIIVNLISKVLGKF